MKLLRFGRKIRYTVNVERSVARPVSSFRTKRSQILISSQYCRAGEQIETSVEIAISTQQRLLSFVLAESEKIINIQLIGYEHFGGTACVDRLDPDI